MGLLALLILACSVGAGLANPASKKRAELVGMLVEDVEVPESSPIDQLMYSSPAPISDAMCASIHEVWQNVPEAIREKIDVLKAAYPNKNAACMWSRQSPPGVPPHNQGACSGAKHYTVLGNRRYCCPTDLKKAPNTYIWGGKFRCVC